MQPSSVLILIIAVGLALLVLGAAALIWRWRARRSIFEAAELAGLQSLTSLQRLPQVAVIAHGEKVAANDPRRNRIMSELKRLGWPDARWYFTTSEDTGAGWAKAARAEGNDIVLVMGGDGTVRAAARELLWTGMPLGLLPAGTGNLLARNLHLPYGNFRHSLSTGLTGKNRLIDAVNIEITDPERSTPREETFLVMAGLGFDAEVMAAVQPRLKESIGWLAYVVAGAKSLRGRRTTVKMTLDDGDTVSLRVRSVVLGNCGELTAGIKLLPDAEVDDGLLDVVTVSPRGLLGWVPVLSQVVLSQRGKSTSAQAGSPVRRPVVQHFRCRSITVQSSRPMPVQLDGDSLGVATRLKATVAHKSLIVRTPASPTE